MMKGKRGKLGTGSIEYRQTRFCIDCGLRKRRFQPGTVIKFGGAERGIGFVCFDCHDFVRRESFSTVEHRRLCPDCLVKRCARYVLQIVQQRRDR